MEKKELFNCFEDFWGLTQDLTDYQRSIILKSLPEEKANSIIKEIKLEKWEDLIYRNKVDSLIDDVKERFGVDLLDKRRKIIKGKSQYISAKCWDYFVSCLSDMDIDIKHYNYVIGGIGIEPDGDAFYLHLATSKERHGSKE